MSQTWGIIVSGVGAVNLLCLGFMIWSLRNLAEKVDGKISEAHCKEHRENCHKGYDREISNIKKDFRGHSHADTGEVVLGGNQ